MCKILMFAGITPNNVAKAWRFAMNAAPLLTQNDDDGFGYAAAAQGQIFGERWLKPKEAFKRRQLRNQSERYTQAQFGDAVDIEETYNCFGDLSLTPNVQAIMLHARMATCAKSLLNTHPFTVEDKSGAPALALIHNGVISNVRELESKNLKSTCDSECILNEYNESEVDRFPGNIQDLADRLEGYYACGVLATQDGPVDAAAPLPQVMDVFKSERASLYVAWIPALGAHVFCTSETIIAKTAKLSKMKVGSMAEVNAGRLIRLDVATGQRLSITKFEESEYIFTSFGDSSRSTISSLVKASKPSASETPAAPDASAATMTASGTGRAMHERDWITEAEERDYLEHMERMDVHNARRDDPAAMVQGSAAWKAED